MAGRRSYRKNLTVHRRSYVTKRGVRVRSTTFKEKDRGSPGRGPKLIPIHGKDEMNKIAREMGYASATDVPDMHIDSYVRRLVKRYGEQSVRGKLQAMVNFRKHEPGKAKTKFELMMASLESQFGGDSWHPKG